MIRSRRKLVLYRRRSTFSSSPEEGALRLHRLQLLQLKKSIEFVDVLLVFQSRLQRGMFTIYSMYYTCRLVVTVPCLAIWTKTSFICNKVTYAHYCSVRSIENETV